MRSFFNLVVPLAIVGFVAAFTAAWWVFDLPDLSALKRSPPKTTAYIELRRRQAAEQGKPFDLRFQWVPYDQISEHLKKAVVTAEDDEFWRHDGIDRAALQNALDRAISERRLSAGGSTITMQLARNLFLSPNKNPLRKAKEILIARKLERELGKRRILELYLNVAEWGKGVFGCEAAARSYFDASCAELNPEEAVALAVVLPNPRRWNPMKRGAYVERNSRRIIGRMRASGWWSDELEQDDEHTFISPSASTAAAPGIQSLSASATAQTDPEGAPLPAP